jgi:hypothetical protein
VVGWACADEPPALAWHGASNVVCMTLLFAPMKLKRIVSPGCAWTEDGMKPGGEPMPTMTSSILFPAGVGVAGWRLKERGFAVLWASADAARSARRAINCMVVELYRRWRRD